MFYIVVIKLIMADNSEEIWLSASKELKDALDSFADERSLDRSPAGRMIITQRLREGGYL